MSLFTQKHTQQLIANCQAQIVRMDNQQPDIDFTPVVGTEYATASGHSAFGFGSAATVYHKKGGGLAIYVEPDQVTTR
jgi:hypothetical protein